MDSGLQGWSSCVEASSLGDGAGRCPSELLELAERVVDEGEDGLVCMSKAFLQINCWVSLELLNLVGTILPRVHKAPTCQSIIKYRKQETRLMYNVSEKRSSLLLKSSTENNCSRVWYHDDVRNYSSHLWGCLPNTIVSLLRNTSQIQRGRLFNSQVHHLCS